MPRLSVTAIALSLAAALRANAQCPDGTPPPCRTRPVTVAAAARRADPPLDEATWIVLPFDNLAKNAEVDWLRDASVNLLYLDLSKWHDVKVVDDERVADLLRAMPDARDGKTLTLSTGIAIAKRAGAGKLVMGDVLKVGARTSVTAKVFDVRDGQRIRTAHEDAPVQDSLMPAFGKLARGILNVAPPGGVKVGEIGTTNTAAYQEYLEGVKALNQFELKTARKHFDAALKQDSTFALAHYKLAVLIGWENASDVSKVTHAEAATRFASALPPRERTLIAGLLAFDRTEYGRACAAYGSLIHSDSTDVEALYGMGECLWHDNIVEVVGGDPTRLRYRGSWNEAIAVFRRALAVDPSLHLAFQHILDSYTADARSSGCRLRDPSAPSWEDGAQCAEMYTTAVRRDGDSLLMVPVSVRDAATLLAHQAQARTTNAHRQNLRKAHEIATEWVDAGPAEPRALVALARIDLLLGEIEAANASLSKVNIATLDDAEKGPAFLAHVELSWKLPGRTADFVRAVDSNTATHPTGQALTYTALGLVSLGRLAILDSIITAQLTRGRAPPVMARYFHDAVRVTLGAGSDSAVASEREMFTLFANGPLSGGGGRRAATVQTLTTLLFGLRLPRTEWPAVDSTADHRLAPVVALAHKDTAALRTAAKVLADAARMAADSLTPDDGSALVAAESYLILGDTTAALRAITIFLDKGIRPTPMFGPIAGNFVFTSFIWPRALLLRADLEVAKGSKATARDLYTRFVTVWAKADPEFQPMVSRARKALASLGG